KLDNYMTLYNTNIYHKERVNKLLQMHAEEISSITAVEAARISKEKPLEEALKNILREDSLHMHVDKDSRQTLISGMGELHLEIVKDS
ncbi:17029_t:CDS:2, partial [Gigaspora rosea]